MTARMTQLVEGQAEAATLVNENFDAVEPAALFGIDVANSNLLTLAYYGGNMMVGTTHTAISDGTWTLNASATNYIECTNAGVSSVNTTGFTAGRIPLYTVVTDATTRTSTTDKRAILFGRTDYQALIISASDETTALTVGTSKITFRMPYAYTMTAVRASLSTAQTSGSIFTVDINEAGSTILSTKLTIDNGEKTSTTAATAAVLSDTSLADDAEITIDIDQVGDGTAKGLKVTLIGYRT